MMIKLKKSGGRFHELNENHIREDMVETNNPSQVRKVGIFNKKGLMWSRML